MNKFEIFIEDGLSENNPYSKEWYSNCGVCDKKLLIADKTFLVRCAVDVELPPTRDPVRQAGFEPGSSRVITKDPLISPYGIITCSLICAEMAILQNI